MVLAMDLFVGVTEEQRFAGFLAHAATAPTKSRFRCCECFRNIPEDAPVFMRRDRVHCSKACRHQCPRGAESPSRAAHAGTVPLRMKKSGSSSSHLNALAATPCEAALPPAAAEDAGRSVREEDKELDDEELAARGCGLPFGILSKVMGGVVKAIVGSLRILAHTQGIFVDHLTTLMFAPIRRSQLQDELHETCEADAYAEKFDASACPTLLPHIVPAASKDVYPDKFDISAPTALLPRIAPAANKDVSFCRGISDASTACSTSSSGRNINEEMLLKEPSVYRKGSGPTCLADDAEAPTTARRRAVRPWGSNP